MVTNCPIYQNKTVLCNLASFLLCIHQYIRSKKKAQLRANLGDSMIWSWLKAGVMGQCTGTLGTRTWHVPRPFVPHAEQKGMTDPAGHAVPINLLSLAKLSIAQTWHWWLYTCTPFICIIPNATSLQLDTGRCGLQSPTIGSGGSSGCPQAVLTWSRSWAEPRAVPTPAAASQKAVASVLCFSALTCDGLSLHKASHGCV